MKLAGQEKAARVGELVSKTFAFMNKRPFVAQSSTVQWPGIRAAAVLGTVGKARCATEAEVLFTYLCIFILLPHRAVFTPPSHQNALH